MRAKSQTGILIVWLITQSICWGQSWTRFRGPNGQGVVADTSFPTTWSVEQVQWKTTLPDEGHSSPVIWGDRLFVTCGSKSPAEGTLLCLDIQSGRILWQKTYALQKYPMNALNHYAATTPAADAERVYVLWNSTAQFTLAALDHMGQPQWQQTYGPMHSKHGPCISPMLYGELVVFTQESRENEKGLGSRWLAVNKRNGEIRWEIKRENSRNDYSTPCVYTTDAGQDQLIFTSLSHGVTGVDPNTGTILWEISEVFKGRTIGSPVLMGDLIIGTSGAGSSGIVMVVVQAPKAGQPAKLLHRIETKLAPFIPTNLALDHRLYTFHDTGTISCWDINQGETLWTEKTPHRFYGSPIAIGHQIYCPNAKGEVLILQAGDRYQELALHPLGEKTQATPAFVNGRLYLRTLTHVLCLGS